MDQIVNSLSLYAVENGLLTRCVSVSDNTESTFQLSVFLPSSVAIVISLGCVSDGFLSIHEVLGTLTPPKVAWDERQFDLYGHPLRRCQM